MILPRYGVMALLSSDHFSEIQPISGQSGLPENYSRWFHLTAAFVDRHYSNNHRETGYTESSEQCYRLFLPCSNFAMALCPLPEA